MADPADADAAWRAGVAYTLDLRGPLGGGVTIGGDVQLLHGHFDQPWDAGHRRPVPAPPDAARLLQPLLRRLPAAWRDWPLDLRVTAAEPLPSGEADERGQVIPDLQITGTALEPCLGGKLAFQSAAGPDQTSGAWYFSPQEPANPTASIKTTTDGGQRETFFYGPRDGGKAITWKSATLEDPFTLPPPQPLPSWVTYDGPWAGWLPTLVPKPEDVFGTAIAGSNLTDAFF